MKTKTKLKSLIIIVVCVALAVICVLSVFLVRNLRLSSAIKKMDTEQKSTVTRVIELCDNDVDILTDIASKYIKKGADEGAGILMHILQNILYSFYQEKCVFVKNLHEKHFYVNLNLTITCGFLSK